MRRRWRALALHTAGVFLLLAFPCIAQAQPVQVLEQAELGLFFEPEQLQVQAASRMPEPISEAPAVVTVITAEQIRAMGARNLMDVLATIPGFFDIQDTNEKVVAGRGVFATTTQKWLLLRDGHRLNEPLFESMMPADSISLAAIDRIEIMRGTGASLYGNAALLGVIHIITKGADAASRVAVEAGNFGRKGADVVANEPLGQGRQMLLFASVRGTNGERMHLPASQDGAAAKVAGAQWIDRRPFNFDIGAKFRGETFTVALGARRADYVAPRSNDGAFLTAQETLNTPRQTLDWRHLDVAATPRLWGADLTLRHYMDHANIKTPQYAATARDAPPAGKAFDLRLESLRAGIEYSGTWEHKGGALLAGLQLENLWLLDSAVESSFADNKTMVEQKPLARVSEYNFALYLQEKRRILPRLTVNAGVRWDQYEAFGGAFNPRLAIVFQASDRLWLKAIYGRAFQAPSYFYRTENLGLGYGAPAGLRPETLDNLQFTAEGHMPAAWFRITAYQNKIRDLITRPAGAATYQNLGRLTTRGVETELRIPIGTQLELTAAHTWLTAVRGQTDASLLAGGLLAQIPRQRAYAAATFRSGLGFSGSLQADWHGAIASPTAVDAGNRIPAATQIHLVLNADRLPFGWDAQIAVHNLTNKRDWRGGTVKLPYPQLGRSIRFTLGRDF